jgi:hypothetical protein
MRVFQSIADSFYLSWHLLCSLFMSQEALKREIAEMRRQIADLKAEATRADGEDKGGEPDPPERYLFAIVVLLLILPPR